MTTKQLKQKYLKFFEEKGHKIISGSSLIPENDPTALFISAGMHPLVPYLLGEKHPSGDKLVNTQKCIRTTDIEKVGNDTHLTFFEMLGNWGLGSYWKKEAIEMSWEFLTDKKWLGLDKDKISISCFAGDSEVKKDEESAKIWELVGIPKNRIKFFGRDQNWWGPAGKTGPCGPDTEMFYGGVEIWNDVFMEYNKTGEAKYEPLKQKNVDTGMGVERTVAVLNNKKSVFDVEPLKSIVEAVRKSAKEKSVRAERIIADHLRAATFILGDEKGIVPSNVEQGYVLRRLIRRAIRYGKKLGIEKSFTHEISKLVIELMSDEYPELKKNKDFVIEQLVQEEEKFHKTLEKGLKRFNEYVLRREPDKRGVGVAWDQRELWGKYAFDLYQTYGFPKEIMQDLCKENDIKFDEKGFEEEFKKHQELSRTATAGKFKSGLADNSEQVTKLHTATHLLLAALRKVLGEHVYQKGSNITAERLRLDFSHSEKLAQEQLKKVEDIVNEQIKKDLSVSCCEMSLEEAKKMGAMGVFESKYKDKVKVYSVGTPECPFSCEICAGPHVEKTGQLGHFKILKEEASSAGVRRIKAAVE